MALDWSEATGLLGTPIFGHSEVGAAGITADKSYHHRCLVTGEVLYGSFHEIANGHTPHCLMAT